MSVPPGFPIEPAQQAQRCYRHPDRATGLACSRCGKPSCPECLREASVGYHCLDCVNEGRRTVRTPATVAGAPVRSTPVVTIVLIALNVLVFAFTAYQAHSIANNAHSPLAQDWELFPYAVAGGQWWRIITSGFIHYGPIHIAMNMIALWIIGRDMETVLGRLRYIVVYVLSLIGGGVAVFLFNNPHGLVAGASGAVFGLMGGVVIACYRLKISPRTALMVIAVNLVFSFSIPGISWLGHLGGLVVGALATVGMLYAPVAKRKPIQLATVIGLFVLLVGLFFLRDAQFAHIICAPHGLRCVQVS